MKQCGLPGMDLVFPGMGVSCISTSMGRSGRSIRTIMLYRSTGRRLLKKVAHPAVDNRLSWKGGTEAQHVLMDRSGGLLGSAIGHCDIQECEENRGPAEELTPYEPDAEDAAMGCREADKARMVLV